MHAEAHHAAGGHLHRRHAHLPIALGEVGIAGREERPLHRHRQEELRASGQLLHVEVAAVLAGRQRAEAVVGGRPAGRDGVGGVGRQSEPPLRRHRGLPSGPGLELRPRGRDATHAHEGSGRDADGARPAALKCQVELELQTGALDLHLEAGRETDVRSPLVRRL